LTCRGPALVSGHGVVRGEVDEPVAVEGDVQPEKADVEVARGGDVVGEHVRESPGNNHAGTLTTSADSRMGEMAAARRSTAGHDVDMVSCAGVRRRARESRRRP